MREDLVRLTIADDAKPTPGRVVLEMDRARAEAIVAMGRAHWPTYRFEIDPIPEADH